MVTFLCALATTLSHDTAQVLWEFNLCTKVMEVVPSTSRASRRIVRWGQSCPTNRWWDRLGLICIAQQDCFGGGPDIFPTRIDALNLSAIVSDTRINLSLSELRERSFRGCLVEASIQPFVSYSPATLLLRVAWSGVGRLFHLAILGTQTSVEDAQLHTLKL